MKSGICMLLLLCLCSAAAMAGEVTECKLGSKLRRIEVVATDGAKGCQVMYTKEDGAPARALWSYQHQPDQCAMRAAEFAQKLGSTGWNCPAAPPTAATVPAK